MGSSPPPADTRQMPKLKGNYGPPKVKRMRKKQLSPTIMGKR